MDTDALIKVTKSSLKEALCREHDLLLPPAVWKECVDQGKAGGHADALRIEENAERGRLRVATPSRPSPMERAIETLRMSGGEADALRLFGGGGVDLVVSDDSRFLRFLADLKVPAATTSALLIGLARSGRLSPAEARSKLEDLSAMISEAQYREARSALEAG